jgi:hypothetical protein
MTALLYMAQNRDGGHILGVFAENQGLDSAQSTRHRHEATSAFELIWHAPSIFMQGFARNTLLQLDVQNTETGS